MKGQVEDSSFKLRPVSSGFAASVQAWSMFSLAA